MEPKTIPACCPRCSVEWNSAFHLEVKRERPERKARLTYTEATVHWDPGVLVGMEPAFVESMLREGSARGHEERGPEVKNIVPGHYVLTCPCGFRSEGDFFKALQFGQ